MKIVPQRCTVTANTIFSVNDCRKTGGWYTLKQQIVLTEGKSRIPKLAPFANRTPTVRDCSGPNTIIITIENRFPLAKYKNPTGRTINLWRAGKDTILIAWSYIPKISISSCHVTLLSVFFFFFFIHTHVRNVRRYKIYNIYVSFFKLTLFISKFSNILNIGCFKLANL